MASEVDSLNHKSLSSIGEWGGGGSANGKTVMGSGWGFLGVLGVSKWVKKRSGWGVLVGCGGEGRGNVMGVNVWFWCRYGNCGGGAVVVFVVVMALVVAVLVTGCCSAGGENEK